MVSRCGLLVEGKLVHNFVGGIDRCYDTIMPISTLRVQRAAFLGKTGSQGKWTGRCSINTPRLLRFRKVKVWCTFCSRRANPHWLSCSYDITCTGMVLIFWQKSNEGVSNMGMCRPEPQNAVWICAIEWEVPRIYMYRTWCRKESDGRGCKRLYIFGVEK